ncbi:PAS domain-containing protein, partial [Sabulibacter ruber]|uniref:PAS domain-containing protein n=1 Tax=Sabulibacter ruber TaxID=2811901 RepID=UPI001A96A202
RRLFDVTENDIGRPFHDLSISYRPVEMRSRIEEVLQGGRPVRIEQLDYHRPPGDPMRLSAEVAPLAGGDGKVLATLLTFTDTTRTHHLQQ